MSEAGFMSVDHYIASQPKATQRALERVRRGIRKGLPGVDESISYNMPTYTLQGRRIIQFAAWKRHYSLYLATQRIAAAFKDELAAYEVKKGTISFTLSDPVPEDLIERIASFRAKETVT